jgi:UDP-N-acetylmuramyl pentapeptide phosphotransferase/UDP-N-acetylglucosamine-1-phosphate transferase
LPYLTNSFTETNLKGLLGFWTLPIIRYSQKRKVSGKRKVVPVLKHYAMKEYGGVYVWIRVLLASTLVGSDWAASRTCRFTPGQRYPGTHWIGGWVSSRAVLDDVVNVPETGSISVFRWESGGGDVL